MHESRPALSPASFDGTYDSNWWRVNRGRLPLYVIVGIWVVDSMGALAIGFIPGLFVYYLLLAIGIWLEIIDNYERRLTLPILLAIACGFLVGIGLAYRFLRHAIKTTRLYLLLKHYSDRDIDAALAKYERLQKSKSKVR